MAIRSIMCCCGQGLGSSMIVSMNVEKALKNLGITGVSVDHTSLNEISPDLADLFVVGFDLAPQMTAYPNKIVLNQLRDMNEITTKLKEVFDKQ